MMKKILFICAGILFFIMLLFALRIIFEQKTMKNGFERKLKDLGLNISKSLDFPLTSMYYFAGNTKDGLYFKDHQNPEIMAFVNFDLSEIKKIPLHLPKGLNGNSIPVNIQANDSLIYFTDKQTGQLTTLNLGSSKKLVYKSANIRLNTAYLTSGMTMIGRTTDLNGGKPSRRLLKVDILKSRVDTSFVFKKQIDGYFCTDGILKPGPDHSRIYYMYAYRGSFLCLDTNLNVIYQAKTIDTVVIAGIKPVNTGKDGHATMLTQSGPAPVVNRNIVLYKNSVLILSAIRADNENYNELRANEVIDVYSAGTGSYRFSFYIPKFKDIKLRGFYLQDRFIYCVFDRYLVKYQVRHPVEM